MATSLSRRIERLEAQQAVHAEPPAGGDAVAAFVASLRRSLKDGDAEEAPADPLDNVPETLVMNAVFSGVIDEIFPRLHPRLQSRVRTTAWSAFLDQLHHRGADEHPTESNP